MWSCTIIGYTLTETVSLQILATMFDFAYEWVMTYVLFHAAPTSLFLVT